MRGAPFAVTSVATLAHGLDPNNAPLSYGAFAVRFEVRGGTSGRAGLLVVNTGPGPLAVLYVSIPDGQGQYADVIDQVFTSVRVIRPT